MYLKQHTILIEQCWEIAYFLFFIINFNLIFIAQNLLIELSMLNISKIHFKHEIKYYEYNSIYSYNSNKSDS